MLRRIAQNLLSLFVGAVVSTALLMLFASLAEQERNTQMAADASRVQAYATAQFNLAHEALLLTSEELARSTTTKDASADASLQNFQDVARLVLGSRDFVLGFSVATPEVINTRDIREARIVRDGHIYALRDQLVVTRPDQRYITNEADVRHDIAASGQNGIAQIAVLEAIETGLPVVSAAMMLQPDGSLALATESNIKKQSGRVVWIYRAVYADGARPRSVAERVTKVTHVVGMLVSLNHLLAPERLKIAEDMTVRLIGPLGSGDVSRLAALGEHRLSLSERTQRLIMGGTQVLTVVAPVGEQAFALRIESMSLGTVNVPLAQRGLALVSGLLIAMGVLFTIQGERKRVVALTKRNTQILARIEGKQRELRASEERFKRLAESTNVIPWAADLDRNRFTYIGPQIEKMTGYPVETWYAEGFWVHHIHPQDRNHALVDGLRGLRPGEYTNREYRIRTANGRVIHVRNMMTLIPSRRKNADGRTNLAQGFLIDVTEMKMAAVALEQARREAEDANRMKSEFLANMSHELRTPLNAVIGFSEIMKEEIFGPIDPRYREYAINIYASGKHLLSLINDILDLSKIEAGRFELAEEETDIMSLIAQCRTLLHERATQAGLHIRVETAGVLPNVICDERRIKQVVLNLVTNAIKFTPPGGSITIIGEVHAGRGMRIAVKDTGIGMSEEEIPKALAKFGQIDSELARKHDGTGLGLPIAKSLMELHGGTLELASRKGEGTTVSIWLPERRFVTASAA